MTDNRARQPNQQPTPPDEKVRVMWMPPDALKPSRWQPREGVGDREAFEALKQNVALHGIKQPLKAFLNEDHDFELIVGHRRLQAAIELGVPFVLTRLLDTPGSDAELQAIREEVYFDNLTHQGLTPMEEARAFQGLQAEGYSIRKIAERLGKSKGYVQNRLDLLRAPEDVQEAAVLPEVQLSHAQAIAKVKEPEKRASLIEKAKAGATKREIEADVKRITQPKPPPKPEPSRVVKPEPLPELQAKPTDRLHPLPPDQITCAGAGAHCPFCGVGKGKEVCNNCHKDRWVIAFASLDDYLDAQQRVADLVS